MKLMAKTVNTGGDTLRSEHTLDVKVPGLVPLKERTHYRKVGGTSSHHGPRLDNKYPNNRTPDNNHYGTKAFVDSLVSLSHAWHAFVTGDSTQDSRQTPLNINDMSLPYGGKFDIYGNFTTELKKHQFHRVGRDADIRTTRRFPIYPAERSGILLDRKVIAGEVQYLNESFENLWLRKGGYPKPEIHGDHKKATEHYHIYFYN